GRARSTAGRVGRGMPTDHEFRAVAFPENLALKDLAKAYPEARAQGTKELHLAAEGGAVSFYPFGAVTFRDLPSDIRAHELTRLRRAVASLSEAAVEEHFVVR